jgi:aminopeptidase-like protein
LFVAGLSSRKQQSVPEPKSELQPQLGRRGLYRAIGGYRDEKLEEMAMLWVLNQSDGKHSLLDVAERSGLQFETVKEAADLLVTYNLLLEGTQKQAVDSRK